MSVAVMREVSGRCAWCDAPVRQMQDVRASGTPFCGQSHRMKATIRALKAAGKLKGRPTGTARLRASNVTNGGIVDRVLRCASCGEFVRFDVDGFGRCMESCKCSTRWAVATGAA